MRRRTLLTLPPAVLAAGLVGCGKDDSERADRYHDGRIFIATGNTTGVYYQLGGGFADLITQNLPGYEARAEPTGASGENIQRVASGDMDLAFSLADTAGDAATGQAAFEGKPQRVTALTRIYKNYTHLVVRADAKITKFAELRGKRVSTGSPNSGTDVIAGRLLNAGGLNPDRDITRQRLSLPETAKGMQAGTTDALFFAGGLPTPGITDLFTNAPGRYVLLPLGEVHQPMVAKYGAAYGLSDLPKATYATAADVPTVVVANLLLVSPDLPEDLAYKLTKILYENKDKLAIVHPEGGNFDRVSGSATEPVPLHPGAKRFFDSAR